MKAVISHLNMRFSAPRTRLAVHKRGFDELAAVSSTTSTSFTTIALKSKDVTAISGHARLLQRRRFGSDCICRGLANASGRGIREGQGRGLADGCYSAALYVESCRKLEAGCSCVML